MAFTKTTNSMIKGAVATVNQAGSGTYMFWSLTYLV